VGGNGGNDGGDVNGGDGRKVKYPSECDNEYVAWYPFVTHLVVMNPEHLKPFNIEDPTYELYDILEETWRMIQHGIDTCADAIPADALRYF
ncbi:hypothetical protein IFM89_010223, partial [Coptis chinensis]